MFDLTFVVLESYFDVWLNIKFFLYSAAAGAEASSCVEREESFEWVNQSSTCYCEWLFLVVVDNVILVVVVIVSIMIIVICCRFFLVFLLLWM